jgi:DNA-nicking Smr family endonuclease
MTKQRPASQDHADEAQTFRAAVRDVKPLAPITPPAGLARRKPRPRKADLAALAAESIAADLPLVEANVTAADALSFHRPGVRDQVLRRLRRGQYPVEEELDLHGHSQANARDLLAEFITLCRQAGCRCVRIIHGKGYRSGARGPVLKSAVNEWLRRHPDVLAFTSARAIDGGTGAVYVLLRA